MSTSRQKISLPQLFYRAVSVYTRNMPYHRGKERIIRLLHRYTSPSTNLKRTQINPGILVDLDINEHIDRSIYYYGHYEYDCLNVFKNYLRLGMIVVDCGAHIGQYTLVASYMVGSSGKVHAFEPSPHSFAALEHNIELNGFSNVWLNQKALFRNEANKHMFYVSQDDNQGANSLACTTEKLAAASFSVDVTTLDDYFAQRKRLPHFIKIDTEGSELPFSSEQNRS